MFARMLYKIDIETLSVVKKVVFDDLISGLGWMPSGKMLISSMNDRRIVQFDEESGETCEHADVKELTKYRVNDMVVDFNGNAFIG